VPSLEELRGRRRELAMRKRNLILNSDLFISGVCMVVLVLLTITAVFVRYVLNRPFAWIEEIQMILFLWAAVFGASVAFREGSHIAIEIVVDLLPRRVQKIIEAIIAIMIFCSLIYMLYLQIGRCSDLIQSGRASNILRIPMWLDYFGVAIAFLFMAIHFTVWYLNSVKNAGTRGEMSA
jgi:TRAP-type C4-dicarboxylate transport system permease small subunit